MINKNYDSAKVFFVSVEFLFFFLNFLQSCCPISFFHKDCRIYLSFSYFYHTTQKKHYTSSKRKKRFLFCVFSKDYGRNILCYLHSSRLPLIKVKTLFWLDMLSKNDHTCQILSCGCNITFELENFQYSEAKTKILMGGVIRKDS